ncbi:MAG: cobalt transporter CbiM [Bacillota bacterium]|nr:cobalt transporter CbiM [Bacillota bacterium]
MHIPDNYLSPSTCAVLGATMLPVWRRASVKVKEEITRKKMPLLGIGAAFSFLIMMFNVPLPGGTTGHAVGAALIAILMGPYAASMSITVALLIQAMFFGDGGILALGANCFNMAFIMPFSGYYIYKFIRSRVRTEKGALAAVFISAYMAINIGALFAAVELGIQPLLFMDAAGRPMYFPYSMTATVPYILIPHLLVAGFVEAIISGGVYSFILKVSPGLIYEGRTVKTNPIYASLYLLLLLTPLGLLASGKAWAEWGAEEISKVAVNGRVLGYVPQGMKEGFSFKALMSGYSIGGFSQAVGYIFAAAAGCATLIILFKLLQMRKFKP